MNNENANPIQLKEWLELHPYATECDSDAFYVSLANDLHGTWLKSRLTLNAKPEVIRRTALYLAAYVEDIKSGFGLWQAFVERHNALYGKRLPFYDSTEGTETSRPQIADINFIIWHSLQLLQGKPTRMVFPPLLNGLSTLSGMLVERMRKSFDQAPANCRLTALFANPQVYGNFVQLRNLLNWFFAHSYLIEPSVQEKIMMNHRIIADRFKEATDEQKNMFMYGIMQDTIFNYPCGPLALYVKDWLHALVPAGSEAASLYLGMEARPSLFWLVKATDGDSMTLECLQRDDSITVDKAMFKDSDKFESGKTVINCGFVNYGGRWYVSGIIAVSDTADPRLKNVRKAPSKAQLAEVHRNVCRQFLDVNDGKQLAFFGDFAGMNAFFTEKMKWPANDALEKQLGKSRNFTLFADEDKGVTIATNIAEYIKAEGNPLYNKEEAEKKAVLVFINKGQCPIDLLEYLVDEGMLPDASFPTYGNTHNVKVGKRLLQDNWDFIARMFLNEFYWGEAM